MDSHGVLDVSTTLEADPSNPAPIDVVSAVMRMPLPEAAPELLDRTGRWPADRRPQRRDLGHGTHLRAGLRGRPGHDAPTALVMGQPGFGFRHGQVWAATAVWSGNQRYLAESMPDCAGAHGAVLGVGENLMPGELRLAPGQQATLAPARFTWSNSGLDGLSERFHGHVRSMASQPAKPRPVVLNTWEAVYFDHNLDKLTRLAQIAAQVGVERFVLDDGWFLGRRHDQAGLGDWQVDPAVWPDGLGPLADLVHGLGMEFGLWFEPEMANPDSDLARQHPDWLLAAPGAETDPAATWRHQLAVNLAHPEAFSYLLESISTLVAAHGIDFIKWDHNRDVAQPVDRRTGRAGQRAQTAALYRMLDQLRARHPDLEIESCASGGARVDLGIAQRTERFWASDSNDPLERQRIDRWTGLLIPPERVGVHVGPPTAHTSHRTADLSFRLVTALMGHAGIEWDLTQASRSELAWLGRWTGLYKEVRGLIAGGLTVRADLPGGEKRMLHGLVNPSRRHALFTWCRLDTQAAAGTARVQLPGLDPAMTYRVRVRHEVGPPQLQQVAPPAWLAPLLENPQASVDLSGQVLAQHGVPLPNLAPGQGLLLELVAV
jgi:alpha-galactosidase